MARHAYASVKMEGLPHFPRYPFNSLLDTHTHTHAYKLQYLEYHGETILSQQGELAPPLTSEAWSESREAASQLFQQPFCILSFCFMSDDDDEVGVKHSLGSESTPRTISDAGRVLLESLNEQR